MVAYTLSNLTRFPSSGGRPPYKKFLFMFLQEHQSCQQSDIMAIKTLYDRLKTILFSLVVSGGVHSLITSIVVRTESLTNKLG